MKHNKKHLESGVTVNISILSLNVGGITSKLRYNILTEYIEKHEILLFSETRLQKIPQSKFSGYNIFSLKQKTPRHGLALMVKNDLFPFTKKLTATSPCVLWVLLGSSESQIHFILGSVYIPGYNSKFADENDFDKISEDILGFREKYNCPSILMGDFNSRTGNLSNFLDTELCTATPRVNKDEKIDTYGRNLVKMCRDLNLKIVNGCFGNDSGIGNFTCHKKNRNKLNQSVVDYCILSECLVPCISDFSVDVFDRCMSDVHSPICLTIKNVPTVKNIRKLPDEKCEKIPYKSSWNPDKKTEYKNAFVGNDIMQLTRDILSQQLSANPSKEEIDKLVTDLTSVIVNPAKEVGLCKKIRKKSSKPRKSPKQAWFNSECENQRKIFFNAKNDLRKAKTTEEKNRCREKMDQEGREYKKYISLHQKEFTRDLHKNLRHLHRHHPKEYWNILKNSEGTKKSEPKVSMEDFEKHFKHLNQGDSQNNTPTHSFNPNDIDLATIQEFNLDFTVEEVQKNIKSLKNNKSEGLDFVKNEYIKNCPISVVELIVNLFNLILRTGHVPYDWCIGLIVPIFKKKGSQFDPNNYRGITLLSCLGKLFTLCINSRLTKFVTDRDIIGEEQSAFREDYSTMDHVFV